MKQVDSFMLSRGFKKNISPDYMKQKDPWRFTCLTAAYLGNDAKQIRYNEERIETIYRYIAFILPGDIEIRLVHIPGADSEKPNYDKQLYRKKAMLDWESLLEKEEISLNKKVYHSHKRNEPLEKSGGYFNPHSNPLQKYVTKSDKTKSVYKSMDMPYTCTCKHWTKSEKKRNNLVPTMKYHPINDPEFFMNRDYIGVHWNRKFIRAVQAVLNSTKGKIGRGKEFFEEAFGQNEEEFWKILWMPETFIIYRRQYDRNLRERLADRYVSNPELDCDLTNEWWQKFSALSDEKKEIAKQIISQNKFKNDECFCGDKQIDEVLKYYTITRNDAEAEMEE